MRDPYICLERADHARIHVLSMRIRCVQRERQLLEDELNAAVC